VYSGSPPGRVTGSGQPLLDRDATKLAGDAAATQACWAASGDWRRTEPGNRGTANAPNWTWVNESSLITFPEVSSSSRRSGTVVFVSSQYSAAREPSKR